MNISHEAKSPENDVEDVVNDDIDEDDELVLQPPMRFSLKKLLVAQVALVHRADGHKDAVVVVAEAIEKKLKFQ